MESSADTGVMAAGGIAIPSADIIKIIAGCPFMLKSKEIEYLLQSKK